MGLVRHLSLRRVLRTTTAFIVLLTVSLLVVYKANLPPAVQSAVDPLLDFGERPFVFYTFSYHAAPINDLADLLWPLGVQFIEKSKQPFYCKFFNSCSSVSGSGQLKFIDLFGGQYNSWHKKASVIADFYEEYKNDPEIQRADAFICTHPSATCEFFEMFNKPIVILSTIRYDTFRNSIDQWIDWHYRFYRIARNPSNVIAANNLYDVHFTLYYIGVKPILLPSYCGYTNQTYSPTRPGFLLGPRVKKEVLPFILEDLDNVSRTLNSSGVLRPVRDVYKVYRYSDLAAHQGIVQLPVQPSIMSIFEQYRMNIPLFLPSKRLLLEWEMDGRGIMREMQTRHPYDRFRMPAHRSQTHVPDPTVRDRVSADYWNQFCDWYHLPHIIYFDNVTHLVEILNAITPDKLRQISNAMRDYNRRFKDELLEKWKKLLRRMASISRTNVQYS